MSKEFITVVRSYAVNRNGDVKNLDTGRMIKPIRMATGYLAVCIKISGAKKMFTIHRMVAQAFLERVEGKNVVNHINGIKDDNRVENLEWCTYAENLRHARETGLSPKPVQGYGEGCSAAKLTWVKVAAIRERVSRGETHKSIALDYEVNPSTISLIAKGKSWPITETPA
ncbi:HNH endonuclease [Pseudomonas aeruginosa]|nr:HNH endonuclease [Pseudomonas aeruginosa]